MPISRHELQTCMSSFLKTSPASPPGLTEAQQRALLTLLADEDPQMARSVRQKILSCGMSSRAWLARNALTPDPLLRRRVREILDEQDRQDFDNQFLAFCLNEGEQLDLEKAVWLMAQTRYPQVNPAGYSAVLDEMAGEIRPLLQTTSNPQEQLGLINKFLFETREFKGNGQNYYDEENSYINKVIDRRVGNPIGLCVVYLLLARRLKLPIVGIGMPGHFLCRYQSPKDTYFIDAFNQGRILSKAECVRYLLQTSHGYQESFLAPLLPRRIMLRICSNLHQIYQRNKNLAETDRLQRYIVVLAN